MPQRDFTASLVLSGLSLAVTTIANALLIMRFSLSAHPWRVAVRFSIIFWTIKVSFTYLLGCGRATKCIIVSSVFRLRTSPYSVLCGVLGMVAPMPKDFGVRKYSKCVKEVAFTPSSHSS